MTLDREEKRRLMERKLAEAKHKEKRKLVMSAIGIVICGALIFGVKMKANKASGGRIEQGNAQTDYAGLLPDLDTALLTQIEDASRGNRLTKEQGPFQEVRNAAKALVGSWLYVLGEPSFPFEDGVAGADKHRGQPFRLRGEIVDRREEVNVFKDKEQNEVWWLLRTLEGEHFYFVDISASMEVPMMENFVLADGYFFKYYEKKFEGEWLTAPLFVGRAVQQSFRKVPPTQTPSLTLLSDVQDHPIGTHNNPTKLDTNPYLWHLLNVARSVGYDEELRDKAIEDAIVLDEVTLKALVQNPAIFRGRMFELGGMVREARTSQMGENPLRERNISSAWIRNDLVGTNLTHLKAPGDFDFGANKGPIIYHGYFLMLWAYEDTEKNRLRTPVFVVVDAVAQEKITPPFAGQIVLMFLVIAIVIGLFLYVLIKRDKKASDLAMMHVAERRAARRK